MFASLMWFLNPAPYLLAVLAGIMGTLAVRRPVHAALASGMGIAAGTALVHVATVGPWHSIAAWAVFAARTGAIGAAVAFGFGWVLEHRPRATRWLEWAGVAVVIASLWTVTIVYAGSEYKGGGAGGTGLVAWLKTPARITDTSPDQSLYHAYVQGVAAGEGFYATAREALVYQNQVRPAPVDTGSPSAFREPGLYVLLGRLGVGWPMVVAALIVASLAVTAAFALARHFVVAEAALAGAAVVAAFIVGYISTYTIVDAEVWAGMLVLCAVAIACVRPRSAASALALASAAALFAFLATAVREISLPVFGLGLAATLTNPSLRKARAWLPWLVGLGASLAAYAAHWRTAASYVVPVPLVHTSALQFFHPDGKAVWATLQSVQQTLQLTMWAAALLLAAGLAGPMVARMGRTRRILTAGMVLGGTVAVALFRSSGYGLGRIKVPAHWSLIVLPTLLACVPLLLARSFPADGE